MNTDTGKDVFEFPLTPNQASFWFLNQLAPANPAYNIPVAYQVTGPLRSELLESALATVIQRHEILRTTYAERDGSLVQRVHPAADSALKVVNVDSMVCMGSNCSQYEGIPPKTA